MEKRDLKIIASLGDWSDVLMGKVFYATYVKVLEKKFEEHEQSKAQLKDFVQRNWGNVKLPKTPKRMNPAARLFEQIQSFKMVNFDSDDSDGTPVNPEKVKQKSRIPAQLLQQLQNVGLQNEHQTPNLRKHKVSSKKQLSERRPLVALPPTTAPPAVATSSIATLSTAASSTVLSVQSSATRTVAGNSKILDSYKKEQQHLRLKEREMQAEKHRQEILKDKAERARREREERQLRVEANNRQKMAEQKKREQEQREQEERLRVYQLKQKELEKCVRSPAAKNRKMGTPRSLRKPATTMVIQQSQEIIKNAKMLSEVENLQNILQSGRIPGSGLNAVEKAANGNDGMEEKMDDDDEEENFTEYNFVTKESENKDAEESQNGNDGAADAQPVGGMEVEEEVHATPMVSAQHLSDPLQATISQAHSYDMTPDKVFLPSTLDNYNVDDLSSADETDSEEHPRKNIPNWARRAPLMQRVVALRGLITEDQRERHFGRIAPPNINDFFHKYQKEYALRSSSAVWDSPMSDPTPGISRYRV